MATQFLVEVQKAIESCDVHLGNLQTTPPTLDALDTSEDEADIESKIECKIESDLQPDEKRMKKPKWEPKFIRPTLESFTEFREAMKTVELPSFASGDNFWEDSKQNAKQDAKQDQDQGDIFVFTSKEKDSPKGYNFETFDFLKFWTVATPSAFGNTKTGRTETDSSVRNAREISCMEGSLVVLDPIVQQVKNLWTRANMSPKHIRVVPYKMNLYAAGGHFRSHRDTPARNLVGTFLLGLYKSTSERNALKYHLRVVVDDENKKWSLSPGSWCCFYDAEHEVLPCQRNRATLAFKIYADIKDENLETSQDTGLETGIGKEMAVEQWQPPFGFLLSHQYSVGDTQKFCKGRDAQLWQYLLSLKHIELVHCPVTLYVQEDRPFDGESESVTNRSAHVYAIELTKLVHLGIDTILSREAKIQEETLQHSKIPFYEWNSGYQVRQESQEGGYTGNEGVDGSYEALYIYRALICLPQGVE
jgi:hypothetical protein